MEKIYKDGEVLEATDLNASFAELEEKINSILTPKWLPVTLQTGWVEVSGHTPKCAVIGNTVILTGAVLRQAGGADSAILVVPEAARPTSTVFAGATVASNRGVAEIYIAPNGTLATSGYTSAGANLYALPISCNYQLTKE